MVTASIRNDAPRLCALNRICFLCAMLVIANCSQPPTRWVVNQVQSGNCSTTVQRDSVNSGGIQTSTRGETGHDAVAGDQRTRLELATNSDTLRSTVTSIRL
jgi:hypothetical protein